MREGVGRVIDVVFGDLGLTRLDAEIEPANRRSRALAERLGFRHDGAARVQRKIGSRWREHARWTLQRDEWRGAERQELAARA
jgi:ribosomal-protein-alanine N-acetyltransferase